MIDAKSRLKLSNHWHLLATGFGSGLSPIIPGTMGSLAAIPFWLLMYWLLPVLLCWFIILFGFVVGIVICHRTSDDIQVYDHGSIVWDEFIGMWMTLMVIPLVSWQWVLIAFVLFRFFDMLKPWPIGWFDRQVGCGLGIMLDDIIAAIFAMVILAALAHWLPVL
ncbi:Phosphatidylglycerophosphatase A [Arsenophonus endosymbiont of Aleurodicus floccissimus]|uniref:phosphatidylglycerophosphatase A n=1 Tax=Arsenophonus endosymbiont of Aleurodicus floccissimus TaxID=2152761 RepID=UPI000E6AFC07|nr:phosphatidylglycerophosphatase A [Arsenophonus endosymbiont of Aleurodicus floccissimus]SPP32352.1 Phosphatidylglycerophosphatase A [Arsenophonus endosymbiont of Aleurodicus floccissimus]